MKQPLFCAALVGLSAPAHAQNGVSIDLNGQHVRIGIPTYCDNDEGCLSISTSRPGEGRGRADEQQIDAAKLRDIISRVISKRVQEDDDDNEPAPRTPSRRASQSRTSAAIAPAPAVEAPTTSTPAQATPTVAPAHPLPAPGSLRPASPGTESIAAAPTKPESAPVAALPPSTAITPVPPAPMATTSVAPAPAAAAPPSVEQASDSPVGVWVTQNEEARIHIVRCGDSFCGYVVDTYSTRDGAKVLIAMRPVKDRRRSGLVHDPKGGGTYDANMVLKDADTLAIRGCAMGGLICRGQTLVRG